MHALTVRRRTSWPFNSPRTTVHAPQSPSAHPSLVPLRRRSSRKKLRTDFDGLTSSTWTTSRPSTKRTTERSLSVMRLPPLTRAWSHAALFFVNIRAYILCTKFADSCSQFLAAFVLHCRARRLEQRARFSDATGVALFPMLCEQIMLPATIETSNVERIKAWQCIGCGRLDGPQPCLGVCQDRKVELVPASAYDE